MHVLHPVLAMFFYMAPLSAFLKLSLSGLVNGGRYANARIQRPVLAGILTAWVLLILSVVLTGDSVFAMVLHIVEALVAEVGFFIIADRTGLFAIPPRPRTHEKQK